MKRVKNVLAYQKPLKELDLNPDGPIEDEIAQLFPNGDQTFCHPVHLVKSPMSNFFRSLSYTGMMPDASPIELRSQSTVGVFHNNVFPSPVCRASSNSATYTPYRSESIEATEKLAQLDLEPQTYAPVNCSFTPITSPHPWIQPNPPIFQEPLPVVTESWPMVPKDETDDSNMWNQQSEVYRPQSMPVFSSGKGQQFGAQSFQTSSVNDLNEELNNILDATMSIDCDKVSENIIDPAMSSEMEPIFSPQKQTINDSPLFENKQSNFASLCQDDVSTIDAIGECLRIDQSNMYWERHSQYLS